MLLNFYFRAKMFSEFVIYNENGDSSINECIFMVMKPTCVTDSIFSVMISKRCNGNFLF